MTKSELPNQTEFCFHKRSKSSAIPLKPRWCVGDWSIFYFNLCFCSWKIPSSSHLIPNDETMTWNSLFFSNTWRFEYKKTIYPGWAFNKLLYEELLHQEKDLFFFYLKKPLTFMPQFKIVGMFSIKCDSNFFRNSGISYKFLNFHSKNFQN